MDTYPYVETGERMTLTLLTGMTLHGGLVDLHHGPDGLLACVRLHIDGDTEPVAINAAQIALWRRGEPVRTAPQQIMVPAPAGLNGPGSGHGLGPARA